MTRLRLVPRKERAPRQGIKPSVRVRVFRRDDYTCQYCGRRAPDVPLVVDHAVPLARGGSNDEDNLVTACRECNAGKYANLILPADRHRRLLEVWEDVHRTQAVPEDPSLDVLVALEVHDDYPDLAEDAAWLAAHCGGTPDGP